MFCSRLTGAWNQFIATQYSVVVIMVLCDSTDAMV